MTLLTMLVPLFFAFLFLYATVQKVDVYAAFLKGASEGLTMVLRLIPALVGLLTAIGMVRASGALDYLAQLPLFHWLGIPTELLPLMLIRPFSGSGALGVASELMETYGPDSLLGRTASVMLGSTETTFYTIAIYFGAASISKTRYAIPAALCADLTGFLVSIWSVRYFFPT